MPKALIAEEDRRRHTYISGSSGSGKSELIKVLAHNYATRPGYCSTVALDPHGDLAEQIAAWREFAGTDRLIYVDPALQPGYSPVINPFEVKNPTPENVDLAAQEITSVFRELVRGTGITLQMETLLLPCIAAVIRRRGSLLDLQRFMLDDVNDDLVKEGLRSPNLGHRNFFQMGFRSDSYRETKRGLFTRIQSLLNTNAFYHLVVGKSTIDLEKAFREKKTILFNLSGGKIGREAGSAFGRFIIAQIYSLALQRARLPEAERTPVHVFIDECHLYITDSIEEILTGARKYGVHLTLAQQILGQDMDAQLTRIVLGNTAIKFSGKNGLATLKTIAQETGAALEDLQQLTPGTFSLKTSGTAPSLVKIPKHLLGKSNAMSAAAWERMKAWQIKTYYRAVETPEPCPPDSRPTGEMESPTPRKPKYRI